MANRALLHRNQFEQFVQWLVKDGWRLDEVKPSDAFKVLQARKEGRQAPFMLYDRLRGQHFSVLDRDDDVIYAFIRHKRQA